MTTNNSPIAVLALATMGAIFGASFLFMKVLSDEISTFEIVAGRLALGAIVLAAVIKLRGKPFAITAASGRQIAALAVLEAIIPFSLVAWAETRIDAGLASLLISTMPVFTVIAAMLFLADERRAPARLLALPLGVAGVVVLTGGDILSFTGGDAVGQLAVIGAALSYGVGAVYARVLLRTNDPVNLVGTKLACGAVIASVLMFATGGTPSYGGLSAEGWLSLAGIGLLATAGAFTIYIWLVSTAGSVYASMVTYVTPVFGVLFGWAILGERIGLNTAAGAALIAAAIASVMYAPSLVERIGRAARRPVLVPVPVPQPAAVICTEEYA